MNRQYKIYAIDFDGVLCESEYPFIVSPKQDAIDFVKATRKHGDKVILWTCREGRQLKFALDWCKEQGLVFDAINDNLPEMSKYFHVNSRKVYADYYIDDKNLDFEKFLKNKKEM